MKKQKKIEYILTLTPEQAQALVYACDVYIRMSLAQIDTAVSLTLDVPDDALPIVRELCNSLKFAITGMAPNASYGICGKAITKTAHIIHVIEQVVRHRLAWDRKPQGDIGVDFGSPISFGGGGVPHPTIKNNQKTTLDGWLRHKPKPVHGARYNVRQADKRCSEATYVTIKKRHGVYYVVRVGTKYKEKYANIADDVYQWKPIKRGAKCA